MNPPADPLQVALLVADALERCGLRYLLGGSLASSVSGEPRSTLDVVASDPDRFLYVYTPEDILLQKLRWYRRGHEVFDRQWRDVRGIVAVRDVGSTTPIYGEGRRCSASWTYSNARSGRRHLTEVDRATLRMRGGPHATVRARIIGRATLTLSFGLGDRTKVELLPVTVSLVARCSHDTNGSEDTRRFWRPPGQQYETDGPHGREAIRSSQEAR